MIINFFDFLNDLIFSKKFLELILICYEIIPINEIGINIDVEEDQNTFEGNAIKKAETIAKIVLIKKRTAATEYVAILDKFSEINLDKRPVKYDSVLDKSICIFCSICLI